jgi:uncharacterized protein YybS (DUF2232 family)
LNNSTNLRRMIETALLSAIAIGLIVLSSVPFFAFIFVVAAVPITVLTARQGLYAGITGSIITGICLLLLFDPITACMNIILFGFTAIVIGYLIQKKWNPSKVILVSTLLFSLALSAMLFAYSTQSSVDVFAVISKNFDQFSAMIKERSVSLKLSQEDIKIQMDTVKTIKETIEKTKPAILISFGFFLAAVNFFISRPILKRSGTEMSGMVKFKDFRLPSSILPGILLMIVLTFLTDYIGYIDKDIIFINFVVLFNYIFAFQGASTLAFLTVERGGNVEKRSVLVIFATILCVLFFGLQVLSILGLMDATIDIRKIYKNRKV